MTMNQKIAKEYLDQYGQLLYDLEYLKDRLDEQRAKATGIKSYLDIPRGKKGDQDIPLEGSHDRDPQARERLLDVLLWQSIEYENRMKEAQLLASEIEDFITENMDGVKRIILQYRYVKQYRYEKIAVILHYSYQHIKRLHWEALEELGEKMSHNEP